MRLHEHEAATIFRRAGIQVPPFVVAQTAAEAVAALEQVELPVAVKAQVLVGGRGKGGGIAFAGSADEVREKAGALLGGRVKGLPVESVMIARKVPVAYELYAGVTLDPVTGGIAVFLGLEGGVDVEQVSVEQECFYGRTVAPPDEFRGHHARALVREAGFHGDLMVRIAEVLTTLFSVFRRTDALIAEINPLVVAPDEAVWAVDAALEVDDAALFRHPEFPADSLARIGHPLERAARKIGVSYVDLDGDIGII
ncbi:MAG: acetate--CoA ligase family protein, partial [Longimicrobiales bacterium]|nr:acetate--CoA ligase family protein [Longimicrobiales bacterium]